MLGLRGGARFTSAKSRTRSQGVQPCVKTWNSNYILKGFAEAGHVKEEIGSQLSHIRGYMLKRKKENMVITCYEVEIYNLLTQIRFFGSHYIRTYKCEFVMF